MKRMLINKELIQVEVTTIKTKRNISHTKEFHLKLQINLPLQRKNKARMKNGALTLTDNQAKRAFLKTPQQLSLANLVEASPQLHMTTIYQEA